MDYLLSLILDTHTHTHTQSTIASTMIAQPTKAQLGSPAESCSGTETFGGQKPSDVTDGYEKSGSDVLKWLCVCVCGCVHS